MTYIDRLNYKRFEENRDEHLANVEVVNFDIIYHKTRGDELKNPIKHYKIFTKKKLKGMPQKHKEKALGAYFRASRKDLYVNRELAEEYFRTW